MSHSLAITLLAVVSKDGFIARADEPGTAWASAADQAFFKDTLSQHNLFIMGSSTYEAVRPPKSREGLLRVVMTRRPHDYAVEAVAGQLEFTDQPVSQLIGSLEQRGYKKALLLGGSHIFAEFWRVGYVDDAYITYEPVVLGDGIPLFQNLEVSVSTFPVLERKKLNDSGTLLVHYQISK